MVRTLRIVSPGLIAMSGRTAPSLTLWIDLAVIPSVVQWNGWSAISTLIHGVACRSVLSLNHNFTLSHYHTSSNELTLSHIHTCNQVSPRMKELYCLWPSAHCDECFDYGSGVRWIIGIVSRASVQVKPHPFINSFLLINHFPNTPHSFPNIPQLFFRKKTQPGADFVIMAGRKTVPDRFYYIRNPLGLPYIIIIGMDRRRSLPESLMTFRIIFRLFPQYHSDVLQNIARYVFS